MAIDSAPVGLGVKYEGAAIKHLRRRQTNVGSPSSIDRLLVSEHRVSAGIEETFGFFSDPANLQALTPPSLDFAIVTPLPIEMRTGTLIEYRLKLMGIPMGWLSRIEDWQPGRGFTDVQVRGPYAKWRHRHRFMPLDKGTWVRDEIEYAIPLAPWSDPIHALFVRPQLKQIFDYRKVAMTRILG